MCKEMVPDPDDQTVYGVEVSDVCERPGYMVDRQYI